MSPSLLAAIPPRLLYLILASLLIVTYLSLVNFSPNSIQVYIPIPGAGNPQASLPQGTGQVGEEVDEWVGPSMRPFDPEVDGTNLFFSDKECDIKFPGLFTEIDIARDRGNIENASYRDSDSGLVRARIYNGQLYIVAKGNDVWHRMSAILHQIHRALITAPIPSEIPNIDFQFLVNDHPASNTWSLARSDSPKEIHDTWLMPDYSFWSWPEPQIGSYAEAREKIDAVDRKLSWADKEDRAIWRGTVHWNGKLRGKLIEIAEGKPWSDVAELDWKTNALKMEDFCKYKFLIYTEGVTYSGRLRYFQHCRSIIITPALQWHQYHSPLMVSEGPQQNYVIVKDDWSDLEEKIQFYLKNPDEAERIANNTVETFRDHYLTPAGEVCYWRKLFKGWKDVTNDLGVLSLEERGRSWESFVLMGKLDWEATA